MRGDDVAALARGSVAAVAARARTTTARAISPARRARVRRVIAARDCDAMDGMDSLLDPVGRRIWALNARSRRLIDQSAVSDVYARGKGREDYKYKAARSRHSLDARGRARSVSDGSQEMILPGFMML